MSDKETSSVKEHSTGEIVNCESKARKVGSLDNVK